MNKFQKIKALRYAQFVRAQTWVKKHPLTTKQRQLLRQLIDTKRLWYLRVEMDAAGYSDLYEIIRKRFAATGGRTVDAACVKGLAYPDLIPKCEVCDSLIKLLGDTYCSKECDRIGRYAKASASISASRHAETPEQKRTRQKKIKQTNLRRWGAESPMQNSEIKSKVRAAHAKRTPSQKAATQVKGLRTIAAKYGLPNLPSNAMDIPEVRRKQKLNVRKAYKERNEEIQEYRKAKMLEEYGVTHQIYRKEIRDKIQRFRRKTVILGGTTYTCQGFEEHMLKYLHERGYSLTTSDVKGVPYVDADGKERRYYPDAYAKKGQSRLVIEVKSTYTFSWTRTNCPEKFWAGTRWSAKRDADYVIAVIKPGQSKMMLFKNPRTLADLKKEAGLLRTLS